MNRLVMNNLGVFARVVEGEEGGCCNEWLVVVRGDIGV